MRLAMPWNPIGWPSHFPRFTFASGGDVITTFSSIPFRSWSRILCGRSFHGVSSEKPNALLRLYIRTPSQVSGLYRYASFTKQPARMLRDGSGGSRAGASRRIGQEQLGMRQLVNPEAAARAARALGVVEHEVVGLDVAVHEAMRGTRERLVELLALGLRRAFHDLHLHESIAHEECRGDPCLDRLLVPATHHETVDDGIHVLHLRLVELHLLGDVDRLAIDDELAAPLLANLREDEVE